MLDAATPLKTLLVDDEPQILNLLSTHLRTLGFEVIEATNGPEALTSLDKAIKLLVTDIRLPGGLNGFELAQKARALVPELSVLLISGYSGEDLAKNGLPEGWTLLRKPFRRAALGDALRQVLRADSYV